MLAPFAAFRNGSALWVTFSMVVMFTSITVCQKARSISPSHLRPTMPPTLLTRMSMPPRNSAPADAAQRFVGIDEIGVAVSGLCPNEWASATSALGPLSSL